MAQKIERQSAPTRGGLIKRLLLGDIEEDDQPVVNLEDEPSKLIRIRPRGRSAVLPEEPEETFGLDARPAASTAPSPPPALVPALEPSLSPQAETTGEVLDATAALLLRRVERLETGLQLMTGAMKRSHVELVGLAEKARNEAAAALTEARTTQEAELQEIRRAVSETSGAMESRIIRAIDGRRGEGDGPGEAGLADPTLAGQLAALKGSVDHLIEVTQSLPLVLASNAERLAARVEASSADIESSLIAILSVPGTGEGVRMLRDAQPRYRHPRSNGGTVEDAGSIWS
jgi:hypothetical protein